MINVLKDTFNTVTTFSYVYVYPNLTGSIKGLATPKVGKDCMDLLVYIPAWTV